jgi:hypothetical protein
MTDIKHEAQLVTVGLSRGPVTIDSKYTVVIGISGSTDYLRDTTGDRRFWPVHLSRDGLHDEGAPAHCLCSRCFPDLQGDLVETHDDECNEPEGID